MSPFVRDRVDEISDSGHVKLLTVAVDRLPRWYKPGLICIGDAAHAMSPIGGVDLNLAIQNAVDAADILTAPLRAGTVMTEVLVRVTQSLRIAIQKNLIGKVLSGSARPKSPHQGFCNGSRSCSACQLGSSAWVCGRNTSTRREQHRWRARQSEVKGRLALWLHPSRRHLRGLQPHFVERATHQPRGLRFFDKISDIGQGRRLSFRDADGGR